MDDLFGTPKLKTSAELRSLLGRPLNPCPTCGSAIYSVLHDGSLICLGCDWATATGREVAFGVLVVSRGGKAVAADLAQENKACGEARRLEAAVERGREE
jgi:hypothetical protein